MSGSAALQRDITPTANSLAAFKTFHVCKLDVYYSYAVLTVYGESGNKLFTHRYKL